MTEKVLGGGTASRPGASARLGLAAILATAFVLGSASAALAVEAQPEAGAAPQAAPPRPGPIYIPPPHQNISGVWWTQSYMRKLELAEGGELPLNEAGRAKYAEIMAGLANGAITDEARRVCVPDGLPRILSNPYPFQIIQTPGQVTIIYELNHVIRPMRLDVPLPPDDELEIFPYYMGHSAARWENDTLVIETAGFNEKTWLDATGAPHSWQMRTVERIRKLDDNTLENVITIADPTYYTQPFSARFVYDLHRDVRLEDYNCGDEHRDISQIPGVAPRN